MRPQAEICTRGGGKQVRRSGSNDGAIHDITSKMEVSLGNLSSKASQWWSAGKQWTSKVVSEAKTEMKSASWWSGAAARAKNAAQPGDEDPPDLPDMFYDFAPCPVVKGTSDLINGQCFPAPRSQGHLRPYQRSVLQRAGTCWLC
jgi:hypothetical protein